MRTPIRTIAGAFAATAMLWSGLTLAADVSLDELLQQVRQGRAQDNAENQRRLREFQSNRGQQRQLLSQLEGERAAEERRSAQLEAEFETNDARIIELEAQLQERLGDLKELFGVLQQAAGDARGQFEGSLTQVQFTDRSQFMTELAQKLGQSNRLATLEEIERLWFELQQEMTESGKVARFTTNVISTSGDEEQREVVRVGAFNIVSGDRYLNYESETGLLSELPRQPQGRYTKRAGELTGTTSGLVAFPVDPSRGQLLSQLVKAPNLLERIAQGKTVGYVIIALGIIGIIIAVLRLLSLMGVSRKVGSQIKDLDNPKDNPLGRVLKIYHDNPNADLETLELKLGEGILKETPKLNRMLPFLKIIAVVAPLLGLLGTVTGMIVTFQAITLFGTGDPKLMAGGISTALVTTVLGLVVAIPMVFLHTLVSSRAKRVTEVLQQQAAGMVAERAEQQHA